MAHDIGVSTPDDDDVPPRSPLADIDNTYIRDREPKKIVLPKLPNFDPDFKVPQPVYKERELWWAFILEKIDDETYEVALQDNTILNVKYRGVSSDEFDEYQLVLVGYDSNRNEGVILTRPPRKFSRLVQGTVGENVLPSQTDFNITTGKGLFSEIQVGNTIPVKQVIQQGYKAGEVINVVENVTDDTWEPLSSDYKVAVSATDIPDILPNKVYNPGAFDPETCTLVKFDVFEQKLRLFFTGTGGGSITIGCGLTYDEEGVLLFNNSTVAGFGLQAVPLSCQLEVVPGDFTGCHLLTYVDGGDTLIGVDAASLAGPGLATTPASSPCASVPKLRADAEKGVIIGTKIQLSEAAISEDSVVDVYARYNGQLYGWYPLRDRKVAAHDTDPTPSTLINKIANQALYNAEVHQPCFVRIVGNQVELFTNKAEEVISTPTSGSRTILIYNNTSEDITINGANITSAGHFTHTNVTDVYTYSWNGSFWQRSTNTSTYQYHRKEKVVIPAHRGRIGDAVLQGDIWKIIGLDCETVSEIVL